MEAVIQKKFVQALPSDNPYLAPQYIEVLKDTYSHRPELLEAYLHGSWESLEGINQVIKSRWLTEAAMRTIYWSEIKKLLTCDCARYGNDETVIYLLENTEILEQQIFAQSTTTQVSNQLAIMSKQNEDCPIAVESIGADLGAGVIDELSALQCNVITFNPAGEPKNKAYYNLRAEAWDMAAKKFAAGEVMLRNTEPTLVNQLCTPTYKFKNGRIIIESKEDIKNRLGRSPDRSDCYIIGLWALDFVVPQRILKRRRRDRWEPKPQKTSAMAG